MSEIKFKIVRSGTASVLPITGYWVYETDRGLLVDLWHERPRPTISITHKLSPQGELGSEVSREVAPEVVREVLVTLELTPQLALSLGNYLVEVAAQSPDKVH